MITESLNSLLDAAFAPLNIAVAAPVGVMMLGLITGFRHSLEADHVAAVSTIVASQGSKKLRRAPLVGVLWGLGHTATLFVAGLAVLILAVSIPSELSGRLEFLVGIMLIYLGATALTGFSFGKFFRGLSGWGSHRHEHVHSDTGIIHTHEHRHHDHRHGHKSIFVGMVHGMAGSGALMLAVLSSIESVPMGLAYIAIFGAGSIASMAAMSTLIGLPFSRAGDYRRLNLALRYIAAGITLAIGVGLVYELGMIEKVFF